MCVNRTEPLLLLAPLPALDRFTQPNALPPLRALSPSLQEFAEAAEQHLHARSARLQEATTAAVLRGSGGGDGGEGGSGGGGAEGVVDVAALAALQQSSAAMLEQLQGVWGGGGRRLGG